MSIIRSIDLIIESSPISVDSCKIALPMPYVMNPHPELSDPLVLMNLRTSEIRDTKAPNYNPNQFGINYFSISKRITGFDMRTRSKIFTPCLEFGLNSKVLGIEYFDGITADNIERVYEYLMSLNIGKFKIDDLLKKSFCTDIDLKADFNDCGMPFGEFTKQLKGLESIPNLGNRFKKENNKGIQFSSRSTKHYLKNPFLKFYDKKSELIHSEKTDKGHFYKDILSSVYPKSKLPNYRIETTIKDKKHLSSFKIHSRSLGAILFLTSVQKQDILKTSIRKNIQEPINKKTKCLGPTDYVLNEFLNRLSLCSGDSKESIFNDICKKGHLDKVAKSRLKKRLNLD